MNAPEIAVQAESDVIPEAVAAAKRKISAMGRTIRALFLAAVTALGPVALTHDWGPKDDRQEEVSSDIRRYFYELPDGNLLGAEFIVLNADGAETRGKIFRDADDGLCLDIDGHILTPTEASIAAHGEPGKKVNSIRKEGLDFATTLKPPFKGGKLLISSDVVTQIGRTLRERRSPDGTIDVLIDYRIVIQDPMLDMLIPAKLVPREGMQVITLKVKSPDRQHIASSILR